MGIMVCQSKSNPTADLQGQQQVEVCEPAPVYNSIHNGSSHPPAFSNLPTSLPVPVLGVSIRIHEPSRLMIGPSVQHHFGTTNLS